MRTDTHTHAHRLRAKRIWREKTVTKPVRSAVTTGKGGFIVCKQRDAVQSQPGEGRPQPSGGGGQPHRMHIEKIEEKKAAEALSMWMVIQHLCWNDQIIITKEKENI